MNSKQLSPIKIILIFSLLILLFIKCDELFKNDRIDAKYLPNYFKGDTLYFKNESTVDTLVVTIAGYLGSYEGEGMYQVAEYLYAFGLVDIAEYSFFISRRISGYSFFDFSHEYGSYLKFDLHSIDTLVVINEDTIFNLSQSPDLTTDEVYSKIDSDTMVVLKSFLYEINYGLVQYELSNGEIFLLDEKSFKMLKQRN